MTRHAQLVDLLKKMFSNAEQIREFVSSLEGGDRLAGRLSSVSVGRDLYASDVVRIGMKGRYVDAAFFARLREVEVLCIPKIDAVARAFGV